MSRSAVQEGFGVGAQGVVVSAGSIPRERQKSWLVVGWSEDRNCQARACSGASPLPFFPYISSPRSFCCSSRRAGEAQGTAWGQVRDILILAHLANFG